MQLVVFRQRPSKSRVAKSTPLAAPPFNRAPVVLYFAGLLRQVATAGCYGMLPGADPNVPAQSWRHDSEVRIGRSAYRYTQSIPRGGGKHG